MCHLSGVMKNCETWFDILNLSIYNFNKNQHYEHMFGIWINIQNISRCMVFFATLSYRMKYQPATDLQLKFIKLLISEIWRFNLVRHIFINLMLNNWAYRPLCQISLEAAKQLLNYIERYAVTNKINYFWCVKCNFGWEITRKLLHLKSN